MRIIITDSGLGGLGIAALLYEKIKKEVPGSSTELVYVNALPETGRGYNTMSDTDQKIRIFNNVLEGIAIRFKYDLIAIACNTLSVIVHKTIYYQKYKEQILGIVDIGIRSFLQSLEKSNNFQIIIFGTETTIEMGTHRAQLIKSGIPEENIISQICPGLASAIERNYKSRETCQLVIKYVKSALEMLNQESKIIYVYLACTHYGYIAAEFKRSLKQAGVSQFVIYNPNNSMVSDLMEKIKSNSKFHRPANNQPNIEIYSRCAIQQEEIISISQLISQDSFVTVRALQQYKLEPDLFNIM